MERLHPAELEPWKRFLHTSRYSEGVQEYEAATMDAKHG